MYINSQWHHGGTLRPWSGSPLDLIRICDETTSHYQIWFECWLFINNVIGNTSQCISAFIQEHWYLKITLLICASVNQAINGSDNGLSPGRCQTIFWTNARILLIGPIETKFSEILIENQTFSLKIYAFENVVCKMLSISFRSQCVNGSYVSCKYTDQNLIVTHLTVVGRPSVDKALMLDMQHR